MQHAHDVLLPDQRTSSTPTLSTPWVVRVLQIYLWVVLSWSPHVKADLSPYPNILAVRYMHACMHTCSRCPRLLSCLTRAHTVAAPVAVLPLLTLDHLCVCVCTLD